MIFTRTCPKKNVRFFISNGSTFTPNALAAKSAITITAATNPDTPTIRLTVVISTSGGTSGPCLPTK